MAMPRINQEKCDQLLQSLSDEEDDDALIGERVLFSQSQRSATTSPSSTGSNNSRQDDDSGAASCMAKQGEQGQSLPVDLEKARKVVTSTVEATVEAFIAITTVQDLFWHVGVGKSTAMRKQQGVLPCRKCHEDELVGMPYEGKAKETFVEYFGHAHKYAKLKAWVSTTRLEPMVPEEMLLEAERDAVEGDKENRTGTTNAIIARIAAGERMNGYLQYIKNQKVMQTTTTTNNTPNNTKKQPTTPKEGVQQEHSINNNVNNEIKQQREQNLIVERMVVEEMVRHLLDKAASAPPPSLENPPPGYASRRDCDASSDEEDDDDDNGDTSTQTAAVEADDGAQVKDSTKKQTLQAGDVVEYYPPNATFGRKWELRKKTVAVVNPKHNDFPLQLEGGDLLRYQDRIKLVLRIQRNGSLKPNTIENSEFRPLRKFRLKASSVEGTMGGLALSRKVQQFRQVMDQHHQALKENPHTAMVADSAQRPLKPKASTNKKRRHTIGANQLPEDRKNDSSANSDTNAPKKRRVPGKLAVEPPKQCNDNKTGVAVNLWTNCTEKDLLAMIELVKNERTKRRSAPPHMSEEQLQLAIQVRSRIQTLLGCPENTMTLELLIDDISKKSQCSVKELGYFLTGDEKKLVSRGNLQEAAEVWTSWLHEQEGKSSPVNSAATMPDQQHSDSTEVGIALSSIQGPPVCKTAPTNPEKCHRRRVLNEGKAERASPQLPLNEQNQDPHPDKAKLGNKQPKPKWKRNMEQLIGRVKEESKKKRGKVHMTVYQLELAVEVRTMLEEQGASDTRSLDKTLCNLEEAFQRCKERLWNFLEGDQSNFLRQDDLEYLTEKFAALLKAKNN